MAKKKRPATWFELMYARGGLKKTVKAMDMIVAWAVYADQLEDDEPSVEGYAAFWKISYSTAYRELRAFREVLPEFDYPTGFLAVAGVTDFRQRLPGSFKPA